VRQKRQNTPHLGVARGCVGVAVGLLLVILGTHRIAEAQATYRYRRTISAEPGWVRLTIPNEVLQECRQDLGDLRIFSGTSEVPYAQERAIEPAAETLKFSNVESLLGQETTGLLDRGEHPAACDSLDLLLAGEAAFLKPVVLESSQDGVVFRRIAQGSVFRTASASQLTIGFAPNDRRFLRLRLDDHSSAPVQPVSATVHLARSDVPLHSYPVVPKPLTASGAGIDVYSLELPSANLDLVSIGIATDEKAFARNVWVYELLLFRGELSRRLISEGTVTRAPTANPVPLPVNSTVGRRLEVEIERLGTTLPVRHFELWVRPRVLVFYAPAGALELAYGSSTAKPPGYDLARAFSTGQPTAWGVATLGASASLQPSTESTTIPRRGGLLDLTGWERRQALILPPEGSLAYLELSGAITRHLASVRIVDETGAQVPYIVESDLRHTDVPLKHRTTLHGSQANVRITGFDPEAGIDAIGLVASAPEYFERSIEVTEGDPEARAGRDRRLLGRAIWKRTPEAREPEFWIPIEAPRTNQLDLEIENGDDAPIVLAKVAARSVAKRIDFEFSPKENLTLYWRNPGASAPRYDLTLIAHRVVSSPAVAASLGRLEVIYPAPAPLPKWFWTAVVVAGLVVALVLVRVILAPAKSSTSAKESP